MVGGSMGWDGMGLEGIGWDWMGLEKIGFQKHSVMELNVFHNFIESF
jgi:hypothetical protein